MFARHHGREAGRLRGGQKISGNHLRARIGALRFAGAKNFLDRTPAGEHGIKLSPEKTYVRPSGYKIRMEKPPGTDRQWRLVGTVAEGTFCHKPCTVSGGGKSEISKPITDAILTGPVFVADLKKDFDRVAGID